MATKEVTSWIHESSEKAIEFKGKDVSLSAHVLIDQENDIFTAHCLEFDIVADGKTSNQAVQNLLDCVANHISFCLETGNVDNILNPAPKEYWNRFYFCSNKMELPSGSKKIKQTPELSNLIKDIRFSKSHSYAYA
jgi:hypothetical protein